MRNRKEEIRAREEKRYEEIRNCISPEELSFAVWTKDIEEVMHSSRDCYRKPFVQWINEYASGIPHTAWKYSTPRELAEAIWKPYLDSGDKYFENLRQTLTMWIEQYKKSKK
jgi:hypothetical protein